LVNRIAIFQIASLSVGGRGGDAAAVAADRGRATGFSV
jgi:hypothetical protein